MSLLCAVTTGTSPEGDRARPRRQDTRPGHRPSQRPGVGLALGVGLPLPSPLETEALMSVYGDHRRSTWAPVGPSASSAPGWWGCSRRGSGPHAWLFLEGVARGTPGSCGQKGGEPQVGGRVPLCCQGSPEERGQEDLPMGLGSRHTLRGKGPPAGMLGGRSQPGQVRSLPRP